MVAAAVESDRRRARGRLASLAAKAAKNPQDPSAAAAVVEMRRDYRAIALEEHIRKVVDAAPPLTDDQRARLAALLAPGGGQRAA